MLKIQKITPSIARDILDKNDNNRPVNQVAVNRYAEIIAQGKWMFNGDTIAIDIKGNLINGQHRLNAIIKANKSIEGIIVKGLEPSVFTTIDIGRRRSAADALVVSEGATNATNSAAVCSTIIHYNKCADEKISYRRARDFMIPHDDIIKMYRECLHIEPYIREWNKLITVSKFIPPSQYASLRIIFDMVDIEDSGKFFGIFESGANISKTNAINALRSRYITHLSVNSGNRMDKNLSINLIIKAWNLWRQKKDVSILELDAKDICLAK